MNLTTTTFQILKNLRRHKAVIPYIFSNDSIKYIFKNSIYNLKKQNALLTQTPQAFNLKEILITLIP